MSARLSSAHQPAFGIDHRRLALAGAQQRVDHLVDMRPQRKPRELRHHHGIRRDVARHRAHRDELRLGEAADSEDRDEDRRRSADQAEEAGPNATTCPI